MTVQIVADSREQRPYSFTGFDCHVSRGTLATGDYSLLGHEGIVAVERKSLNDLANCITTSRERFKRELARGADMECFVVIVESDPATVLKHRYRSKLNPHSLLQSVITWEVRYGTPFIWAGNRDAAEYQTYWLLQKWIRERDAQEKRTVEPVKIDTQSTQ